MTTLLGIDAGNSRVKVFGEKREMSFLSRVVKGEFVFHMEPGIKESEPGYIVYEYAGHRGIAGELAYEQAPEMSVSLRYAAKANEDVVLRIVLAIHRYATLHKVSGDDFKVVVGQPFEFHAQHKDTLKKLLDGGHTVTVNGVTKVIHVESAVTVEGAAAFWSSPQDGLVRILDFGSGTVNGITVNNGGFRNLESFTYGKGFETTNANADTIVTNVLSRARDLWSRDDIVLLAGGAANADHVQELIMDSFPNSKVLHPTIIYGSEGVLYDPIYANAIGMYELAKRRFL